ncbi:MAG: DUF2064 domain-containing protein [Bacteroidetes bacterium]|nr:DUF2064 domain-containing protein [Bacteroidota bacterium]
MNSYWETCYLIVFSGLRTGVHLPPLSGEEGREKILSIIPSPSIQIVNAHNDVSTNVDAWPKEVTPPGECEFIASAYRRGFEDGYRKVAGIFSFPPALEKKHLEEAFKSIRPLDCCVGADTAGGIYFWGMNRYDEGLIRQQPWGQSSLSKSIIREIGNQKKIMYKLPVLGR